MTDLQARNSAAGHASVDAGHGDRNHHHHHAGQVHPPATVGMSILRLSVAERLAVAAIAIAAMWAIVLWALR